MIANGTTHITSAAKLADVIISANGILLSVAIFSLMVTSIIPAGPFGLHPLMCLP